MQSINNELQRLNEELETSKEELQSSNELNTLNLELQNRNRELGRLGDDLTNLLRSTTLPILMLDNELRIRRITPAAEIMFNVQPTDVGRPVGSLQMGLSTGDVEPLIRGVIETSQAREVELQDRKGRWHVLRVSPYCTSNNRVDGAVLLLIDVDELRTARVVAESARQFAESIVESIKTPIVVLCEEFRVRIANSAFYRDYPFHPSGARNQPFLEINSGLWDLPGLRRALEQIRQERVAAAGLEFELQPPGESRRTVCVELRPVVSLEGGLILVAIEDISARKQAERVLLEEQRRLRSNVEAGSVELAKASSMLRNETLGREQMETALHASENALLQSREELRHLSASLMNAQDAERRRVSRELHDDLSQKVAKLQFDIEILEQNVPFSDVVQAKGRMHDLVHQAAGLSEDLRRVAHQLHPATLDHLGLSVALKLYAEEFSRSTAIAVKFTSLYVPREVPIELASCLYRIVQEALRNVGKHTSNAQVEIVLARDPAGLALFIRDNGEGFDAPSVRAKGGLGLISMQERVRLLNGTFSVDTRPGEGVLISIVCPLPEPGS